MSGDGNFMDPAEEEKYLHDNRTQLSEDGKRVEKYKDGKLADPDWKGIEASEDAEKEFQELTEMMRKDQEEAQTKKLQGSALSSWAERKLRE